MQFDRVDCSDEIAHGGIFEQGQWGGHAAEASCEGRGEPAAERLFGATPTTTARMSGHHSAESASAAARLYLVSGATIETVSCSLKSQMYVRIALTFPTMMHR